MFGSNTAISAKKPSRSTPRSGIDSRVATADVEAELYTGDAEARSHGHGQGEPGELAAAAALASDAVKARVLVHIAQNLAGEGGADLAPERLAELVQLEADGALTATYPFMPRFAVGGGMWGGIQPGLSRFDAGPRLSYQLRLGLRAHLDYRFRVTGNAEPRSGPALTLAAGF